jgi:PAS domain S-box-containing protein
MNGRFDAGIAKRWTVFAASAAVFSMMVGLSVLTGWTLNILVLLTWGGGVPMAPNAAACFVLAGLALWIRTERDIQSFASVRNLTARTAAVIVSLVGLLSLAEVLFRRDLGIDRLVLLRSPVGQTATARIFMSPITAGAFLLLGLALLGIDWRTRRENWPAQFLCLGAALASPFGLVALVLGPSVSPITLPLPTILTLLALAAGLLCSRATWAMGGLLIRKSPGARLLRRVLPASLLVLGLIGWLISKALLTEIHLTWVEASVLATLIAAMLAGFVGWIAFIVDRSSAEREKLEEVPQVNKEQLDRLLNRSEEPQAEKLLRRKVNAGFAVAVLVTVLLSFLSWRGAQQAAEDADQVAHTHEVMTMLESTLRHSLDVETGGRGFAITGSVPFLELYESGRQAVVQDLLVLRLLLGTSPQVQRLNVLEQQANNQIEDVEEIVATRQNTGKVPAVALFERGKYFMDAVRVTIERMEVAEERRLGPRTKRTRASQHFASVVITLGSLLGVIFLSIAGITASREIGVSARARTQVNALNADLERLVVQRTAALGESEERFEALANGIPQLAWMAEADGSIFWYNQRWYEYTGTTFAQMQGWGWQSIHDPGILPKVLEGWNTAIAAGNPFEMEFPMRGADRLFRTFLTRVMPLKDSAGRVVRWFGTNTDISERKQTEERLAAQTVELSRQAEELRRSKHALEAQKLMLQSVLDSMVEGLVAADEQGKFILWNPAAEKILGLGAANLSPEGWSAHYGAYLPDTVTPFPNEQNPLLRAIGGEVSSAEIFFRNSALSRVVWIECNGSPLRDKDGEVRGGVAAFRDITQRKADELEIRKLNEELEGRIAKRTAQLEAANQELEAFSYSVSHDLRAPLRHIGSFSKILMQDFGPEMALEARDHLQHIEDAVIRMGLLVDGLLSLARLGRQSLKLRHTELNAIVDEVISMLQPECEGRDVEWRIAKLPALDCDPILMAQVFQNLLGNALKYSRGRASAVIEADSIQQPGKPAIIFVRDNGAGFNMKYAEKLFGVFQRFHTDSEFEGTGVGLATVHRIIQKHGGTIWAEAEPDHGATFYFTLQGNGQAGMTEKATAAHELAVEP